MGGAAVEARAREGSTRRRSVAGMRRRAESAQSAPHPHTRACACGCGAMLPRRALADQKAATEELEERLLRARSSSGQSVAASAAELSTLQKEHTEFLETGAMTRERMINQLVRARPAISHATSLAISLAISVAALHPHPAAHLPTPGGGEGGLLSPLFPILASRACWCRSGCVPRRCRRWIC